ncbi:unnamed protein product [Prunus armeniaca]|uniref:MADS-box domain-containing protein n=1 Tax=Prunus armeniaca TaxID=36596 RepID=A0A6J5VAD2_PRUAR|nr:unnamed protein product [Prunus armeniaca]
MTRKKVKLAYIANDSTRKATFKKRKRGLIKKISELSTLCDVPACALIYSQYESLPDIWPSPSGVQRVIAQFRNMPEMEQGRKMFNQETFLRQRIVKAHEQLKRLRKENREKEVSRVMFQTLTGRPLQGLNMIDLNDLGWLIDQNVKELGEKIKSKREELLAQSKREELLAQINEVTVAAPNAAALPARAGDHGMDLNMQQPAMENTMQRPPCFSDVMTPQEPMGFGAAGGDEVLPFGDQNHPAFWHNSPFFH